MKNSDTQLINDTLNYQINATKYSGGELKQIIIDHVATENGTSIKHIVASGNYKIDDALYTGADIASMPAQLLDLQQLESMSNWDSLGIIGLGIVVGWNLYFLNRYKSKTESTIGNLLKVAFALIITAGLGITLKVTGISYELLYKYGLGLLIGFFGYLAFLIFLTVKGKKFPKFFLEPPEGQIPHFTENCKQKDDQRSDKE